MARIDPFIQQLHKTAAHGLLLAADARVVLITASGLRPITSEPWTMDHVMAALREIVAPGTDLSPARTEGVRFQYTSPHGQVRAVFSQAQGKTRLVVEPAGGASVAGAREMPRGLAAAPAPSSGGVQRTATPSGSPTMVSLFRKMVAEGCSDLHISTGNPPLFRKDGDIVALGETERLTRERTRELLLGIAPPDDRARFEQHHDVDFSYEVPALARFRCNLFMDRHGPGGVFRVIPSKIPTAEELGLSKQVLELCHLNKGLIVVTGPTGSGKSTTLAAMIDYINRTINGHLITIEDPIEFVHENRKCLVNQREVGHHTRDFKAALRAALREDPDFVLVGEMRDLETVAIAIETAETGHLVFGTLHTNTAASAVDRMIDQFPADRQAQVRTMLADSLRGVIAQVLCKKRGGGRVAAYEILIVNSAISNLVREGKTFQIPSLMQTGKSQGMICLNDSLFDLVQRNLVDPREAFSKSVSKSEFRSLLTRNGITLEGS